MDQFQTYINSVENSEVAEWMYTHFDFLGYTLGFYMVFLFWATGVVKNLLINLRIFHSSTSVKSGEKAMPPHGSATIAFAQLLGNILLISGAYVAFIGTLAPVRAVLENVGFHDTVCVPQETIIERGPVIFWTCFFCFLLYLDILYSGLMAAQNIYKELEVAQNKGLPVPAKVTSGVRFIEYVYRGATFACPWQMLAISFSAISSPMLNGMIGMMVHHALLAVQNLTVILAPATAAKHELKFLISRHAARILEGAIGIVPMIYTYTASDCDAMPYTNRIAIIYYALVMLFTVVDLKKIYKSGENPMHVIYENDLPENRVQKLKQN